MKRASLASQDGRTLLGLKLVLLLIHLAGVKWDNMILKFTCISHICWIICMSLCVF